MASPSDAPLGLRERKNRRTRLAIVKATAELTFEVGFAAATIAKIAERADVAPRTVSTWFPAKDDIFFENGDEQIARGVAHLRDGDGDVVDRLMAWFADEGERGEQDLELSRLRNEAIHHDPELRARYRQYFDRIQQEIASAAGASTGLPATAMGPYLLAGAAMAFVEQLAAQSTEEAPTGLDDPQVRDAIAFLRAGLASFSAPPAANP